MIDTRKYFWFGTEERAQFIATPLRGADSSPTGWGVEGTYISGGGYSEHSWGSHKRYTFEWPASSSVEMAQLMKSYRDGTYGRGLLYFLDPTTFRTNVLPAMWADPSIVSPNPSRIRTPIERSVIPGATVIERVPYQTNRALNLPLYSVELSAPGSVRLGGWGFPGKKESVFIPIPEGHTLMLGAFYEDIGGGTETTRLFASEGTDTGEVGEAIEVPPLNYGGVDQVNTEISSRPGITGVWLWWGSPESDTLPPVRITAATARIVETKKLPLTATHPIIRDPWIGGQGHSGCRFSGEPSYVNNGPFEGGRIGFAATFIEVGWWRR